jgi:hypothetical protein
VPEAPCSWKLLSASGSQILAQTSDTKAIYAGQVVEYKVTVTNVAASSIVVLMFAARTLRAHGRNNNEHRNIGYTAINGKAKAP